MAQIRMTPDMFREHEKRAMQTAGELENLLSNSRGLLSVHGLIDGFGAEKYDDEFKQAVSQLESSLHFFECYREFCRRAVEEFERSLIIYEGTDHFS